MRCALLACVVVMLAAPVMATDLSFVGDRQEAIIVRDRAHFARSLNGGFVYYLKERWAVSDEVRQINLQTGADKSVIDGNLVSVIREGKYGGYLLVVRHQYLPLGGSFECINIVRPDGQETFPASDPRATSNRVVARILAAWPNRDEAACAPEATARATPEPQQRLVPPAAPVAPPTPPSVPPAPQRAECSTGSGYAIDTVGTVVTNNHVIDGCRVLAIRRGEQRAPAQLIARDASNDLALIRSALPGIQPVKFREGKGMRAADGIVAIGYPYAGLLATTTQVTIGSVTALAGLGDDTRMLQISAPIQPGNSGGPLFDMSGNVVGTVVATLDPLLMAKATGSVPQNVNFAIKAGVVQAFLDARGQSYQTAPSATKLEAADVGEVGARSVVMIECMK